MPGPKPFFLVKHQSNANQESIDHTKQAQQCMRKIRSLREALTGTLHGLFSGKKPVGGLIFWRQILIEPFQKPFLDEQVQKLIRLFGTQA